MIKYTKQKGCAYIIVITIIMILAIPILIMSNPPDNTQEIQREFISLKQQPCVTVAQYHDFIDLVFLQEQDYPNSSAIRLRREHFKFCNSSSHFEEKGGAGHHYREEIDE